MNDTTKQPLPTLIDSKKTMDKFKLSAKDYAVSSFQPDHDSYLMKRIEMMEADMRSCREENKKISMDLTMMQIDIEAEVHSIGASPIQRDNQQPCCDPRIFKVIEMMQNEIKVCREENKQFRTDLTMMYVDMNSMQCELNRFREENQRLRDEIQKAQTMQNHTRSQSSTDMNIKVVQNEIKKFRMEISTIRESMKSCQKGSTDTKIEIKQNISRCPTMQSKKENKAKRKASIEPFTAQKLEYFQKKDESFQRYAKTKEGLYPIKEMSVKKIDSKHIVCFYKKIYIPSQLRAKIIKHYKATYGNAAGREKLLENCIWPEIELDFQDDRQ